MKRFYHALLAATLSVDLCHAQSIERDASWLSLAQGWEIVQSATYKGCVAIAKYKDGTTFRFGFDGIVKDYFVNFSNFKWDGYKDNETFDLQFLLGRGGRFHGSFRTTTREGMPTFESGNIKIAFIEALANASAFRIVQDRRILTGLTLGGSRRAFESMTECQKALDDR